MKSTLLGVQVDGDFLENEEWWPGWRPWIIKIAGDPLSGTVSLELSGTRGFAELGGETGDP
jgi:hypothetical protein